MRSAMPSPQLRHVAASAEKEHVRRNTRLSLPFMGMLELLWSNDFPSIRHVQRRAHKLWVGRIVLGLTARRAR